MCQFSDLLLMSFSYPILDKDSMPETNANAIVIVNQCLNDLKQCCSLFARSGQISELTPTVSPLTVRVVATED